MTHCISVMLWNASCQLRTGLRVTRASSPKLEAMMYLLQSVTITLSFEKYAGTLMCAKNKFLSCMCKLSAAAQPLDSSSLADSALVMKLADITSMSKQCFMKGGVHESVWLLCTCSQQMKRFAVKEQQGQNKYVQYALMAASGLPAPAVCRLKSIGWQAI